jgi:TetR/AcrR family transcriptional repressor of nem operon
MMPIMRYPDGHKQEVRARIVAAAARALRQHGIAGVSIPALMKDAGLTHGGFYAHFADRDELVAEAIAFAGQQTADNVFAEELSLEQAMAHYLSEAHVAHPEQGCVVAALGSEGGQHAPSVRHAFSQVAVGLLRLVQRKLDRAAAGRAPSDAALRTTATMVGAVVLSRLVRDEKLASRILRVARSSVAE